MTTASTIYSKWNRFARYISMVWLLFVVLGTRPATAQRVAEAIGWDAVPAILANIQSPAFPDRDFDARQHGARPDGKTDCRPAIMAAIKACHESGGGRVILEAGDWYCKGPVHLKSNVNLHLKEGATLRFSPQPKDFLPVVLTRFEGTELMNFSPPIYAFEQENIALTGKGTIDGQADDDHWWDWKGSGNEHVAKLLEYGEGNVPVAERHFGGDYRIRVNFVQFYRCKNILIEDITVHRSPMWEVNPVLCENVTVRGVHIDSHGPNNDGCNPECCKNVLIEECYFDTGDDCIAIKSGRNADGRRVGVASENIVVRNCQMKDGHGGVVLGSEMSGGIRNVFVEDCTMDSPHLERAIRLKSNSMRGGYLENMFVRNIDVGQVSDAVVRINLQYWAPESGDYPPRVSNIVIENVTSKKSTRPLYLVGLENSHIDGVVLRNCQFRGASKPSLIENVKRLTWENVTQADK
ncbi:MAG: glycoside hydrolase family 28 protein [Pirellulaceae bacterium]|nr:glycoside hydrolase family 28 protein [Planctomycetales bacterium]